MSFDKSALRDHLIEFASKCGLDVDETIIQACFEVFEPYFTDEAFMQLRTTEKPGKKRVLNWRCELLDMETLPPKPWELIVGKEEIVAPYPRKDVRNFGYLVDQLSRTFPTASLAVDFDLCLGLTKLWHFGRNSVFEVIAMCDELPAAVPAHKSFFMENGLSDCYCTGVDYTSDSMNFYFIFPGSCKDDVTSILRGAGLLRAFTDSMGSPKEMDEVLDACASSDAFATTFRWDSPAIERVCFYVPTRYFEGWQCPPDNIVGVVRTQFPLPSQVDEPAGFVGCSIGVAGYYAKFELDYNRSYFSFLRSLINFQAGGTLIDVV